MVTNSPSTLGPVNKSDEFGRLLSGAINSIAQYEGKTAAAVQDELGERIGLSGATIERYKRGHLPPEPNTVRMLAEAGVRRGYLNRRWLSRFLSLAQYPSPVILLDALCPAGDNAPAPGKVLHNLPPPSYAQFVMRPRPFEDMVEALGQRTAAVIVSSLGGMGKTSLVREVAARCLAGDGALPRFDAAVWVSDAERPGATTLDGVLDEIARTLRFDGLIERGPDEKRREVEHVLRGRRVLVVADNFETVTDPLLLRWLLSLPEPSKAVITTREYRREYRLGTWPVELRGMTDAEARDFAAQRLRMLRLDPQAVTDDEVGQLAAATGGNPKAMEIALGGLKYEHRALQDVLDDLISARGDVFEDLLERAWSSLDEPARRALLAATLFAPSADPGALAAAADVRPAAMGRAVERLADLALLDVLQEAGRPARYALHPLVRAFASAELAKDPALAGAARARCVDWYAARVANVGYCRDDLGRLSLLDPDRDMLHIVLDWARRDERHDRVLALAEGSGYYCYVHGLMNRAPDVNLAAAEAARALRKPADELRWLSYHMQRKARSGDVREVERVLPRARALAEAYPMTPEAAEVYRHAVATYHLADGRPGDAEREWRALLAVDGISALARLIAVRWLATCLRETGRLDEARVVLEGALASAADGANLRAVVALQLQLCRVLLDAGGDEAVAAAEVLLAQARGLIGQHGIERHAPDALMVEGQVATARGDSERARAAYAAAAEHFRRIGLWRELAEAEALG